MHVWKVKCLVLLLTFLVDVLCFPFQLLLKENISYWAIYKLASRNIMNSQILDDCSPVLFEYKPCTDYFDEVIGHIEDIVMDREFQISQKTFLDKYYDIFEDSDENKLIYMDIFQEYTELIEDYIEKELNKKMTDFDMEQFATDLRLKRPYLDGEIFDLLLSLFDFLVFKEMILDYKSEKEGKFNDVQLGIIVTKLTEFDESFRK